MHGHNEAKWSKIYTAIDKVTIDVIESPVSVLSHESSNPILRYWSKWSYRNSVLQRAVKIHAIDISSDIASDNRHFLPTFTPVSPVLRKAPAK